MGTAQTGEGDGDAPSLSTSSQSFCAPAAPAPLTDTGKVGEIGGLGKGVGEALASLSLPLSVQTELENVLQCSVCISTVVRPVSLGCGHTFCKVCLTTSLQRSKKKCPTCRAVCHIDPAAAKENTMLANISRVVMGSGVYASRAEEADCQLAELGEQLPIFFYNSALVPGEMLGLHLFEPRYRIMMKRIVENGRKFVYLPSFERYSAKEGDIGLVAELEECSEFHDGRWQLGATMKERLRITEAWVEDGTFHLWYCKLERIRDQKGENETRTVDSAKRCLAKLNEAGDVGVPVEKPQAAMPALTAANAESVSFWIASRLHLRARDSMQILRDTDTVSRFSHLMEFLDARIAHKRAEHERAALRASERQAREQEQEQERRDSRQANLEMAGGTAVASPAVEGSHGVSSLSLSQTDRPIVLGPGHPLYHPDFRGSLPIVPSALAWGREEGHAEEERGERPL
uniref:RING-type domain-containing protein n=1 Tax=Chromera velia CCMP2878 TaxID=1169474 RepID=A0A0G4F647_9ALVE|eukprot:Cvel_15380.t1-p1 / transcript=Cvel_15380.t1 / gene=Cvel_15380 / organism=Chromera_velia_CCMP2878 / gene_product=LON peptidase N-terminal domain and RING finger, putative / transcript_product=LON peptidase N-terminal domain and RING finger, putative / location=Cvel_scaffold1135:4990-10973(-) / protein_length=458 / sequence_SO=supercontig / SO=protein_coding / is_pseudo=false